MILSRWCPAGHPFRSNRAFGDAATRAEDPPASRTHEEVKQQGKDSDEYTGPANAHPSNTTGVNGVCALVYLHLFNLIWDVCPDMMHIVKNFFEKFTFKVFNGSRVPTWVASKNKEPAKDAPDFDRKMRAHKSARKRWERAVKQHKSVVFDDHSKSLVDRRIKQLVGPSNWIKSSMVTALLGTTHACTPYFSFGNLGYMLTYSNMSVYILAYMYFFVLSTIESQSVNIYDNLVHILETLQVPFATIEGSRKPNTADWMTFLRTCIPYVMGDVGPVAPRATYAALTDLLNALLDATADFVANDPLQEQAQLVESRALHLQAVEALCLLERDFPLTELAIFVHEILHVPEFVYRWNAVRNYWCFGTERFVGWMKRFVKNRSLCVENMVYSPSNL